jgi:hypothetical protein
MQWTDHITTGQVVDTPAGFIDVAPTILKIAGGAPVKSDGMDLLNLPADRTVFFDAFDPSPGYAVRRGKWKFYLNWEGTQDRLYDVEADKAENINQAASNPALVKELTAAISQFTEIPQMAPVLGIDDAPTTEVGQHDRHRDAILSVGTDRKRPHGRRQPVAAGSAGLRRMALSSTAAITCLPPIMSPAQAILAAGRSDAGSRQRATLARRPRRAGRRRSGHAGRSGRRS